MLQTRFKKNAKVFDIVITSVGGTLSVGIMLYAVMHFGLAEAWPELVLNLFYIACLTMIWMYFFNRLDSHRFNYCHGSVARHSLCAAAGFLCTPCHVSYPLGGVTLHAYLFLCAQKLEELYQAQPVAHLRTRYHYSRAL